MRQLHQSVRVHAGRISRTFAAMVCSPLRYVIIILWLALAAAILTHPAATGPEESASRALPVPRSAPPVQAEISAARLFGLPILARTILVQRAPKGLSLRAQKRVVTRAVRVSRGKDADLPGLVAAFPILNDLKLVPGSREAGTTAITYLYFRPTLTLRDDDRLAETLEHNHVQRPADHLIGATGFAPAWARQGDIIGNSLHQVEIATVLLIFVIVGLTFRSLIAPFLTLIAAGTGYIVGERAVEALAVNQGAAVPIELKPLLVVLVLAVTTDYAIFFMSGFRRCLQAGVEPGDAVRTATANTSPIILVAGLTIAACTGCLLLAHLEFLRVLGPALSVAVISAALVSLTLVPALMASLGRLTFWPRRFRTVAPGARRAGRWRRLTTWRPLALLTSVISVVGLLYLAGNVTRLSVGLGLLDGLPPSLPESQAYHALQRGFAPGFLAPTVIVFRGPHLSSQHAALRQLQSLIAGDPDVAGTLGPRDQPGSFGTRLVYARDGRAARLAVLLKHDPYGGRAVSDLSRIQRDMPRWLKQAHLRNVRVAYAGDTALVKYTVDAILDSLLPVALAIGLIVFLLLAALLRSLVAPLYLIGSSVLAVVAPLGLTTLLFQDRLHHDGLAYYVPVGVGVLLFALGSDYNLFLVGKIWDEAEDRSLREAIAMGSKDATGAIGVAAITLAGSFALLVIIPLTGFREFAFAMAVGVLIDAFVVRSYLVPALVALVGRLSLYPGWGRRSVVRSE